MRIIAYLVIIVAIFNMLTAPFLQGEERSPRTAGDTVCAFLDFVVFTALCGRVLGWF